jgi:hypothetical protein
MGNASWRFRLDCSFLRKGEIKDGRGGQLADPKKRKRRVWISKEKRIFAM